MFKDEIEAIVALVSFASFVSLLALTRGTGSCDVTGLRNLHAHRSIHVQVSRPRIHPGRPFLLATYKRFLYVGPHQPLLGQPAQEKLDSPHTHYKIHF